MSKQQPTRAELEREVLSDLSADSAAWILGLPRTTFLSRKPPKSINGGYSAREVVAWLTARFEALIDPPNLDSAELRRLRSAKAAMAETDLAERLGALTVARLDAERDRRALTILQSWAIEICGTNPGIFARYRFACRKAFEHVLREIPPSDCSVVLRITPNDGSDAFDIAMGTTDNEAISLPEIEEWPEIHVCPRCGSELWPSWGVATDGSETPIWCCRSTNCKTNWGTHEIPRHCPQKEVEERNA